jgi:hypothetical protein
MFKKTILFFILVLFCVPLYARAKLKVYPNPWIPESGKSLDTKKGDEMKHGSYTTDGWIKFEGVAERLEGDPPPEYGGTLRIYDITGHLVKFKKWTIEEETSIPLPQTSKERYLESVLDDEGNPKNEWKRVTNIVHWDGKDNNYEYVESGVYIWIITEDDGSKHDGKVVVIR